MSSLLEVTTPCPFAQRACVKTITVSQVNRRCQPEFCLTVCAAYVNVHGLSRIAFVGVEEEPERLVAEYDWHVLQFNGVQNFSQIGR